MNTQKFSLSSLILASFLTLTCFTSARSFAEVVERLEAVVNKKAIYKSDVNKFRKTTPLRAKVDPLFNNTAISHEANPTDAEIVNFLVNEEIIAEKFPVADADVEQEINGIQGNLKIDRDGLKQAITREGFKFEDYFQLMRISIAKRQLIDREIRNKAAVNEDDLKSEYNRQAAGSKTFTGSFHTYLIKITKGNFKTPALAKAEAQKVVDSLKKGEAFDEVAKRESDDSSASNGGDLGYLSYKDMSPVLQKEVQKMGPEKTSGIVDDQKSFLILKIADIKADVDGAFDSEKEAIRSKLLEGEFQHQIGLWLDRQRAQNYIKINNTTPS